MFIVYVHVDLIEPTVLTSRQVGPTVFMIYEIFQLAKPLDDYGVVLFACGFLCSGTRHTALFLFVSSMARCSNTNYVCSALSSTALECRRHHNNTLQPTTNLPTNN